MARLGVVILFGAIIASMGVALYMFSMYQTELIYASEGEPVQLGPVRYIITYEGQHSGDRDTKPDHSFFKIGIEAENNSGEEQTISGLQFFLIVENGTKIEPVYGEFSDEDLLYHTIPPGQTVRYTTQFDAPFDEDGEYSVGIQPRKEQDSNLRAIVCLLGCPNGSA